MSGAGTAPYPARTGIAQPAATSGRCAFPCLNATICTAIRAVSTDPPTAPIGHRRWLVLLIKSLGAPRVSARLVLLGVLFLDTGGIRRSRW
jgi:hypothetical protein